LLLQTRKIWKIKLQQFKNPQNREKCKDVSIVRDVGRVFS
jgi:hypothetical protein